MDASTFVWQEYMARINPRLLSHAETRRILTEHDPLLFALVYLRESLGGPLVGNQVSFNQFHLDLVENAKQWMKPSGIAEHRDAYIAPRGSGKSTWCFMALPFWAAAHGHVRFIAAFADSGNQAELHLATFKRKLRTNKLLMRDYPDLCTPARTTRGTTDIDTKQMYLAQSGFVFSAKGADSASLGMKVGDQRPDLILLDDIEPHESAYSEYQKNKRLDTILSSIFHMNLNARIVIAGTTTMAGSIIHDLVRTVTEVEAPEWPQEQNIRAHYYPAILTKEDGSEASLWPERWAIEDLQRDRRTRQFAKEMMNQPVSVDGGFWEPVDFTHPVPTNITRRIISIDPAITSKTTSDYTGVAVIGYDPVEQRCTVERVEQLKVTPAKLRERIVQLIQFDASIKLVVIEANQGGDTWAEVLSPLPVEIRSFHQTRDKATRAAQALDWYQNGWVSHPRPLPQFEAQAMSFPRAANDDMVDAVCSGLAVFLSARKKNVAQARTREYA